jgi:phage-related baseplate assembly protein
MAAPQFITADLDAILIETIQDYQTKTGKVLVPTDVEYLLLQTSAYREFLLRVAVQSAAEQNLVDFATGGVLDYLGALVGVERLSEAFATVTLQFSITGPHGALVIPAGTRVQSADGIAIFQTIQDFNIAASLVSNIQTVSAIAQQAGTASNGYVPGTITTLIDPLAFVSAVTNIETTAGGSDIETDTSLRERIKLAPSQFSTAGSFDAYKFHARSASALISDVSVLGPPQTTPGVVEIYPLMADGSVTPSQVITAVQNACNAEKVRPLTDTVLVQAPTRVNYTISAELTVFVNSDQTAIINQVTAALQAYVDNKRSVLGQDVTESQVIAQCQIPGVYSVSLPAWSDIIVDNTEFPFCTAISVTVIGTTLG